MTPDISPISNLHRAGVDMGGLMTVLSRHLYSTPVVAVRELVQNAHDSITRRRIEDENWDGTGNIRIIGDSTRNALYISDTGAGLTEEEIHSYLATVGISYTRNLRQSVQGTQGLIGMFGLGFLSAFVLAKRVIVETTSFQQPSQGYRYISSNAENYAVTPIPARPIGTLVTLELYDEHQTVAETAYLQGVLNQYCALLNEPIYIGNSEHPLNGEPPPWRQPNEMIPHAVQRRRIELAFAAKFEQQFEPICTLQVLPQGASDAQGLIWVQDGRSYSTSDNRNLQVFVRGMLLDDNARDLLPIWAGFIGGVIESNLLTPTASREDIQRDEQYRHVQHVLKEALIQGLADISKNQPEAWRRILLRHNEALLGAALCEDRLFDLLMDVVKIPTSKGEVTAREIVARGKVHVVLETRDGFEEILFKSIGIPVAHGCRYAVIPFLRRWSEAKGIALVELGTEKGNRQIFTPVMISAVEREWLESRFKDNDEKLIVAAFEPSILPLIVVPDRDVELKKRLEQDVGDKDISHSALRLARQFAAKIEGSHERLLYLNSENPAIAALRRKVGQDILGVDRAVMLLQAFKNLVIGAAAGRDGALPEALGGVTATAEALIES